MTLHPIAIVDQVLAEYRSYLATEFRASDERLRQALERALDEPGFLAQEPFFQAHRPFKDGKRWDELGLDAALAKVMIRRTGQERAYLHQSAAIEHLLAPHPSPLVVTTGTGSGKTECFLLPVIHNAIVDSSRFDRRGLTAILIYPMNALANDQEERIRLYLEESGHTHVSVARYDRTTTQEERERMRRNPPHILLTNYMMLEYLLVRPADREALFANHRCRFIVLDEVHTYRGALGANIALLFRRLLAHLRSATQDWRAHDRSDPVRFPVPVPVATSATIKSVDERGRTREEIERLRNEAVQDFFSRLTGAERASIRIIGEELRDVATPPEARWPEKVVTIPPPDSRDREAVRRALCALAGVDEHTDLETAARSAAILWKLGDLLARRPLSLTGLVERICEEVPERRGADESAVRQEVEAALVAGAALPDELPGALRLRTHRFVRGGWRFYRCVDPSCGRLHPMGEERCSCGRATAPLYLCRSCGADTLRFTCEGEPEEDVLRPWEGRGEGKEWLLYDWGRFSEAANADEELIEREMKGRSVKRGSFDPATCSFSSDEALYPMKAVLAPARNRCLVCGAWAGAGSILTPVALGTSAAVRVLAEGLVEGLAEQNRARPGHDGKERLLIFADSRQDAAHQARFITYAGRYDRMRRRLVSVLEEAGRPLGIDDIVRELMVLGVRNRDNPHTSGFEDPEYIPEAVQARARAWEEALLLDDLAVSASYRSTVMNLGLVGVRYDKLDAYVEKEGQGLARELGLSTQQFLHLCRCLLDELRRRGALSRPLLRYHPLSPNCPDELKPAVTDWERRFQSPVGFACDDEGNPVSYRDTIEAPEGITLTNPWRAPKRGGREPSLQRHMKRLLKAFGGKDPGHRDMEEVLVFLCRGPQFLQPTELHGHRKKMKLLQVNADVVQLALLRPEERMRCSVCSVRLPWAVEGAPCPRCHATLRHWPDKEIAQNRFVARIRKRDLLPLHAGEHTAQITGEARIRLEEDFKAPPSKAPTNVLACSPTLEMGIDVGGLDAVVMRNIPPRPDNYAQRGGRAGRRSRVGVVLAYARSTPHDGYFFDRPEEMIAGEVPAPGLGLGSRDVVLRHLYAIAFGAAEPGLSGRMGDYITLQGELVAERVDELIDAVSNRFDYAAKLALQAWGPEILEPAGLGSREVLLAALHELPERIRNVFDRVRLQIVQLQETIKRWQELKSGNRAADRAAVNAMELKRRLLGIRGERDGGGEADDRTGGHPMRRFAEFGILPGYEFPSEPATLRLLGDAHEEEPVTVERRFGIAQYQPEAHAHARGHRWEVIGLDLSSPWNPKTNEPGWLYTVCKRCELRYGAQEHVRCPRCGSDEAIGNGLPAFEYGGFLARRSDTPVLDEEERYATANLVQIYPQRTGDVIARYRLPLEWWLELRVREDVSWLNEWRPPTAAEFAQGKPRLHEQGRGFYLCSSCGRVLRVPDPTNKKARTKTRTGGVEDPYSHAPGCQQVGEPPRPHAIVARGRATTLRLCVPLPFDVSKKDYRKWGLSLGYALRIGLRHLYMLDGSEVDFVLEPSWPTEHEGRGFCQGALTFVDPAVGGSGFLERAVAELHLVAQRALEHLDHPGCETACYRCLKSYNNQRFHEELEWPRIISDLEALASQPPTPQPLHQGDVYDPSPWLEAFDAGVGSPLELRFLRLFEEHGLAVEKQVPVAPVEGAPAISIADFVIPGSRVTIFVDGAAFHRGERLRRDRKIRDRLRSGPASWRVVELRASDLSRGAALVEEIRAIEKG